jgi:hypothetical protein
MQFRAACRLSASGSFRRHACDQEPSPAEEQPLSLGSISYESADTLRSVGRQALATPARDWEFRLASRLQPPLLPVLAGCAQKGVIKLIA